MTSTFRSFACAFLLIAATASAATEPATEPAPSPTRDFDVSDLDAARRLAVATVQDLGCALESVDAETGTIVASRLDTYPLRLSITISARSETAISATVIASYGDLALTDPRPADAFFAAYAAALNPPPELD